MLCALGARFACMFRVLRVGVALRYLAEHYNGYAGRV